MFKKFEKWHGCKNDFIIFYTSAHDSEMIKSELIKHAPRFCGKDGNGIGADGILLLETKLPNDPLPHKLTIINSDGSIALNCGNGLRVAALSSRKRALELDPATGPVELITLMVEDKIFHARFSEGGSKTYPYVNVDMGIATSNNALQWHQDSIKRMKAFAKEYGIVFSEEDLSSTELGNPHIVWKINEASRPLLHKIGPRIQGFFNDGGVNLHLVKEEGITNDDQSKAVIHTGKKISEKYTMFCWERGAGHDNQKNEKKKDQENHQQEQQKHQQQQQKQKHHHMFRTRRWTRIMNLNLNKHKRMVRIGMMDIYQEKK